MECRTKRLLIRDFMAEDRPSVRVWRADPEVTRYLDQPLGADADSWFDAVLRFGAQHPRSAHDAAIILRATGDVIGWIGIGRSMDPGAGDLVVGYALARAWWGEGYMTEALAAVLRFGFAELGARSISAQCYVANPASARVMDKAGMKPAGRAVSADPSLGESVRYVALREDWRRPGRRRFGLVLVFALVALVAVPTALSQVLEYFQRPGAPADRRLVPWAPRGDLAADRDFLDEAARVWRDATGPPAGAGLESVHALWAGTIGSGRVAILQAVGDDGTGYLAQVADHGQTGGLRFDAQEPLGSTRPTALVVNYDGVSDVPLLRPGSGSALLRLVLPPTDAAAPGAAVADSSRRTPAARPAAAPVAAPAGAPTLWRRVRALPSAGESDWEPLPVSDSGLTDTWLHMDGRSPDGSIVLLVRPAGNGANSVTTLAASPTRLVARQPAFRLADPTWGPMTGVDLAAYDDALAAQAVVSPAVLGSDFALLASFGPADHRVSVLEARAPGAPRLVLLAWDAGRLACLADHPYADLAARSVVAVGCVDPQTRAVTVAVVPRTGVARTDVRDASGRVRIGSEAGVPRVATFPAAMSPDLPMTATAYDTDGTRLDLVGVKVSGATPPQR